MAGNSVTRQDLIDAVCHKATLSRTEAADMVGRVLAEICDTLTSGESVKLSGFGRFEVRAKGQRVGRNPKTKEAVPIEPRQVVLFRPSPVLRARINGHKVPGAGTSS
jgi:integration host factor subunit alpha